MKQVITKEEVSDAIEQLRAQGKRSTLAAIHAVLNHRGSMSTLVRLKAELQNADDPSPADSLEGLKTFREMWALAAAEGRREQETKLTDLRESLSSLLAENERLEGKIVAATAKAQEWEREKEITESEFRDYRFRVQAEIDGARVSAAQANIKVGEALARLADAQAIHNAEIKSLQNERDNTIKKSHESELKLVRALALLESVGLQVCDNASSIHNS